MTYLPVALSIAGTDPSGGGGIMPDIFVPSDTVGSTKYFTEIVNKGLTYKFALNYTDNNRTKLKKFKSSAELQEFLEKQDLFAKMMLYAKKSGVICSKEEKDKSKPLIERQVIAYIERNVLNEKGFYPYINQTDKCVQKALNILKASSKNLSLGLFTVFIILVVNIFTKGFLKSISILLGLVIGTLIASGMGQVNFTPVIQAPLLHIPTVFYFGAPTFEFSSIVMMCIIATVSMVESTGVYLALSDITKDPIDETRLRNGYRAEGLAVLLGGVFKTFPYTGFSQNVGLVKMSGIKTRLPIYYAAGFLVLLGLLPKFGALAQIIPSPVIGGAMIVMFGFVSLQGMQMLARVDFVNNEHNFLIAAVSIAVGVGFNNSNLFNSLPTAFRMFFSNGIVMASILAVVLNAILNRKKK